MTTSTLKSSNAFTLLEVLLAIGLATILAFVAVPVMDGWWSEHLMREKASDLVEIVQRAKLIAETEGKRQVIVLSSEGEQNGQESIRNVHTFVCDKQYTWKFFRFDGREDARERRTIAIDSRGRVEPMSFRLENAGRMIQYRFDFLTGHAKEEEYSL